MTLKLTLLPLLVLTAGTANALPNHPNPLPQLMQPLNNLNKPHEVLTTPCPAHQPQPQNSPPRLNISYGQCYHLIHPDFGPLVNSTWGNSAVPFQWLAFKQYHEPRRLQVCRTEYCDDDEGFVKNHGTFYLRDLGGSPMSHWQPRFLNVFEGVPSQVWPDAQDTQGKRARFTASAVAHGDWLRVQVVDSATGYNGLHVNSDSWPEHSYVYTDRVENSLSFWFVRCDGHGGDDDVEEEEEAD
ncbi:hypothetical protein ASPACDRAFT_58591 [Aspergillus aculeatus ATCC 16872]|uniref:Uncharacterized protein n=1 Tax=Aspergillus aculeatus (strain ATCC 16872 / CBS 172.66 / WB 5094) TaxID=690307 RepID=A0A1L9X150_ASPA1|nr:uncharacterized protein ASPACDRAFT_58591 [Aspergillus aculeatus ATCC 16872]OJK02245.1 hypothetical protein ASPACDRAFT_58591 [Aspergillus aculeatus ATCC 16872]